MLVVVNTKQRLLALTAVFATVPIEVPSVTPPLAANGKPLAAVVLPHTDNGDPVQTLDPVPSINDTLATVEDIMVMEQT